MLTIESATNPMYATADGTCIALQVKFAEIKEVLPFAASPHDPMSYGVDLYNRAQAGEFGEVAEYVPPPAPVIESTQTPVADTGASADGGDSSITT